MVEDEGEGSTLRSRFEGGESATGFLERERRADVYNLRRERDGRQGQSNSRTRRECSTPRRAIHLTRRFRVGKMTMSLLDY